MGPRGRSISGSRASVNETPAAGRGGGGGVTGFFQY